MVRRYFLGNDGAFLRIPMSALFVRERGLVRHRIAGDSRGLAAFASGEWASDFVSKRLIGVGLGHCCCLTYCLRAQRGAFGGLRSGTRWS